MTSGLPVIREWLRFDSHNPNYIRPIFCLMAASKRSLHVPSLSSMLQAGWKTGSGGTPKAEPAKAGQVRSFRITHLDRAAKKIVVELT